MTSVVLIVAVDRGFAIGKDGDLPWRLPADLAHFKRATLGATVIMGRKTFDSIGRPLPKRENIVITRQVDWEAEGCIRAGNLDQAIRLASSDPVYVIGGGEIYAQAMQLADRMIITHVDTEISDADTFFPQVDETQWKISGQRTHEADERNRFSMVFTEYEKIPS